MRLHEEEDCNNTNWEWRNKIAKTHQLPHVQCSVNDLNGVTKKDQIKHELRK